MKHDLSPAGQAELASLGAELPRLEWKLVRAEARYAEDRLRYEMRREYPKVREEEIIVIQGIGRIRRRVELTRAEIARLRGEGSPPRRLSVVVDDRATRSIERAFGGS